jgi:O-antigen/teichoic acid export membrane protein
MAGIGKRIVLNTLTGYFAFFMSVVILYLLTPYILSHVGKDAFGLWSLIFSLLSFFELLDFGFYTGVVKYVAQCKATDDQNRCNKILSTTLYVYIFLASIGLTGLFVIGVFFNNFFSIPNDLHHTALILLALLATRSIIICLPLAIFRGLLFGEQYIYIINLTSTFMTALYALSAWYLLGEGYGIVTLGVLNLLSVIFEYGFYITISFYLVKGLRISKSLADFSIFRELLSFTSMQFMANLSVMVVSQSAPMIVQYYFSLAAVSLYAIALRLSSYIFRFVKQMTVVLTPIIAHQHTTKNYDEIRRIMIQGTKYALVPATIFLVSGWIFSHELIVFWVGEEFAFSAVLLNIMLITMWTSTTQTISVDIIAMSEHQHLLGRNFAISITVFLICSFILVHPFGMAGVAAANFCSAIAGIFLWARTVCKFYDISYIHYIKKSILPSVAAGIVQAAITLGLKDLYSPGNIFDIILLSVPGSLAFLIMYWSFFMDSIEKKWFKTKFRVQLFRRA